MFAMGNRLHVDLASFDVVNMTVVQDRGTCTINLNMFSDEAMCGTGSNQQGGNQQSGKGGHHQGDTGIDEDGCQEVQGRKSNNKGKNKGKGKGKGKNHGDLRKCDWCHAYNYVRKAGNRIQICLSCHPMGTLFRED